MIIGAGDLFDRRHEGKGLLQGMVPLTTKQNVIEKKRIQVILLWQDCKKKFRHQRDGLL
jgi:hypothetical protein